jgi:uncharacterized protein (TIGR02466 family)
MTNPETAKAVAGQGPEHLFSTTVWIRRIANHEHLNAKLIALSDTLEVTALSVARSNVGGWHSHDKLQTLAQFSDFTGVIGKVCAQCAKHLDFDFENFDLVITQMWMNKNGPGDFNKPHVHPNSFLSGVYYVQTPPQCGNIEFYDPIPGRTMIGYPVREGGSGSSSSKEFMPEAGMLLVFPSWLQHGVQPNRSSDLRMSISFNVAYRAKNRSGPRKDKVGP